MRLRFSLRTLFIVTILVAIACYWLMLPSLHARRFVRAVKSSDFAAADKCFRDVDDQFLAKFNAEYWTFRLHADLEPWSGAEFLRGERRIGFHLAFGGPRPMIVRGGNIIATARGLGPLQVTSGGFGGGGIL